MRTFCSSAQQCPCCGNNLYLGPIPSHLVGSKLESHKSTILQGQPKLLYALLMVQGAGDECKPWQKMESSDRTPPVGWAGAQSVPWGAQKISLQTLAPLPCIFFFSFIFPICTEKGTSVTVANSSSKVGDTGVSQSTIIRWWLLFFVWLNNIFSLNPTWPPLAESHKNKTKERENQPETDTRHGKSWFRG